MALKQMGLTEIVRTLNQKKILTPVRYAISNDLKGNYDKENGDNGSIYAELSNCTRSWEVESDEHRKEQFELQLQIDCLERGLDAQNKERQKIYEDMVLGKINTTEYSDLKSVLPNLKSELLKKRQQLEQMETEMKIRQ